MVTLTLKVLIGFGEYLQDILAIQQVGAFADGHGILMDLHKPHHMLVSLLPTQHLHRGYCICNIHTIQKINDMKGIPDSIKVKLKSLLELYQPTDWDGTLAHLKDEGGQLVQGNEALNTFIVYMLYTDSFAQQL
jgi:hypothetical protein